MKHVSGNLYRGPRPKTFADLKAAGISTVINLQSGFHEELKDDTYERELGSDFGIVEYNISLSDLLPPKEWQVRKVMRIIGQSQGKVYIHCLHGKDRTGFMCAVYRMAFQQWTFKEAVRELFEEGFHKFPYLLWLPSLAAYEVQWSEREHL